MSKKPFITVVLFVVILFLHSNLMAKIQYKVATFGAGCFWCVEAIFSHLKGVHSVVVGYSGGSVVSPTYEDVCAGKTGHAEVCQITFNPEQISYRLLLEVFFSVHNPTTLNRQDNDIGTQYRSVIFYHDAEQKKQLESMITELNESHAFPSLIVTEIQKFEKFYPAESYHQNYFQTNSTQPYCRMIIAPKLQKFKQAFNISLKK